MAKHRPARSLALQRPDVRQGVVVGAVLAALGGAALLFAVDPASCPLFPPCLFHATTGLSCPGCGTTRALHQLLHGHVVTAFWLNPLMVLSLPVLACLPLRGLVRGWRGRPAGGSVPAIWIWMLLGVIVLFWVLRNVPFYPFSVFAS